jgi:hypothetical protein
MTALTGKQFIDSLTRAQLTDLSQYIATRLERMDTAELMAGVVADQRVNPVTHGLPHGLVDMNATGMAIHDSIQEQKAAERAAAAEERTRGNGSAH